MSIEPQWQALQHCSRCGHKLDQRQVGDRLRPACPNCNFIVYLDPKVACGILIERDQQILLVQRAREPGKGLWCLPAGFEDADEAPETTAHREAYEETGLHIQLGKVFGIYHYTDDPRGAGILIIYHATCTDTSSLRPGDDAANIAFFDRHNLPPISNQSHQRAINDWLAQFDAPLR
jgi:ADP-ribose pyrophosphatase YjhB (NUDIX family)